MCRHVEVVQGRSHRAPHNLTEKNDPYGLCPGILFVGGRTFCGTTVWVSIYGTPSDILESPPSVPSSG
jgi:hypothetical protein